MSFAWSDPRAARVNGVRLTFREVGDPTGAPVLLLHGTGSDSATWVRFGARVAASGRRAIAVDLRGHADSGRSGDYALEDLRDDVLGLLETLALEDVSLVGHSVGGYAALAAALERPHLVSRLVLEDLAAPAPTAAPLSAGALLRLALSGRGMLRLRRHYDLRAVAAFVRQLSRPDGAWWESLADVRQPTLVLSGGPTSCIPPQRLADVVDALPDARLVTLPVGHRVHSLAPEPFADAVLAFLDEPERRSGAQSGRVFAANS